MRACSACHTAAPLSSYRHASVRQAAPAVILLGTTRASLLALPACTHPVVPAGTHKRLLKQAEGLHALWGQALVEFPWLAGHKRDIILAEPRLRLAGKVRAETFADSPGVSSLRPQEQLRTRGMRSRARLATCAGGKQESGRWGRHPAATSRGSTAPAEASGPRQLQIWASTEASCLLQVPYFVSVRQGNHAWRHFQAGKGSMVLRQQQSQASTGALAALMAKQCASMRTLSQVQALQTASCLLGQL